MKEATQDRAEILGEYILDTGATVRAAAKVFKISKSDFLFYQEVQRQNLGKNRTVSNFSRSFR